MSGGGKMSGAGDVAVGGTGASDPAPSAHGAADASANATSTARHPLRFTPRTCGPAVRHNRSISSTTLCIAVGYSDPTTLLRRVPIFST